MPLDEISARWVEDLQATGAVREDAHARLHDLLLRAARAEIGRRSGRTRLSGVELDDLAYQAAADAMLAVLGLDPEAFEAGTAGAGTAEHAALDALVAGLVERRDAARARKDYATADAIRDSLAAAGIQLEDGAAGTHWSLT